MDLNIKIKLENYLLGLRKYTIRNNFSNNKKNYHALA